MSFVPGIGERVQPSADVGVGAVTAYFVDNERLGVLVRLELYPDKDGPDRRVGLSFTSVGSRDHELRLSQMHRRGVAA